MVEFGEFLCTTVLKQVPHRHVVFSLPKILRRYFLFDRKLLADLSRCAWECLKTFLKVSCPDENSIPGVVVAVQTFGDFLSFHPHCHILMTDGCFHDSDKFTIAPPLDCEKLENLFRHKIFKLLLSKEKITEELVENLMTWTHSGFHVFCGEPISPGNETTMENLARYIIRASISQERMKYLDQEGKIVYASKDGALSKEFPALEWMANICSHIPNPGQQMVRYYGFYSNASRGKRLKEECDNMVPSISESLGTGKTFRRNWARLIQKIYEIDPLVCPKCQGAMKIISFISEGAVIEKILKHLGLWLIQPRPPPPRSVKEACEAVESSLDASSSDGFFPDPDYSWAEYE